MLGEDIVQSGQSQIEVQSLFCNESCTMERSLGRHAVVRGRNGKQTKVEANDVQPREVRCGHSSCETCEQGVATPCGADGAKGRSQGEFGRS